MSTPLELCKLFSCANVKVQWCQRSRAPFIAQELFNLVNIGHFLIKLLLLVLRWTIFDLPFKSFTNLLLAENSSCLSTRTVESRKFEVLGTRGFISNDQ